MDTLHVDYYDLVDFFQVHPEKGLPDETYLTFIYSDNNKKLVFQVDFITTAIGIS